MTTSMPTLPVSVEQLAIAIRQMSLTDRRRLLELAPELREAATALPQTLKEATISVEYTQAAVPQAGMMLTDYIHAAMHKAAYEILPDSTFYGEIPGLPGVYANAAALDDCRKELQEVLEGWIVLGLQLGHALPVVDGVTLVVRPETT
jgi:predicted RNase H-like HicB family nuclease